MTHGERKRAFARLLSVLLAVSNTGIFYSIGTWQHAALAALFFLVPVLCVWYPDAMGAPILIKWPIEIRTPPIPKALILLVAWVVLAYLVAAAIVVSGISLLLR